VRRAANPVLAVPAPVPRRTKCEGLDEVAHRALLALVSAPQILSDSGVGGGAGVEGAKGACWLSVRHLMATPGGATSNRTIFST
jgi:hypothetical protein